MAVVKGFGGMRVIDGQLHLNPFLPKHWKSYAFKIRWRGTLLNVKVTPKETTIQNEADTDTILILHGQQIDIKADESANIPQLAARNST